MYFWQRFLIALALMWLISSDLSEASYRCGIRKHSFVQLAHHAWKVERGQWPWHVAIYHRTDTGDKNYACGGTLLSEKHILTAAHCAIIPSTEIPLAVDRLELHFGQHNLSEGSSNVAIRDVQKVHIHPDYKSFKKDIAAMVTRLAVVFTEFIIPICMDRKADRDLRNLVGTRGWVAGWGTTETGKFSDVLRTVSLPVVTHLECVNDNEMAFGNLINRDVFCAGDRNGSSPGTGDSGGGMYFSDGDRWVLRGIISFGRADELNNEVDTSKYTVFVNVQRFLTWINEVMAEDQQQVERAPKRISERECERFAKLTKKKTNGLCDNSRHPHTVQLVYADGSVRCTGVLISENYVLTTCSCICFYSFDMHFIEHDHPTDVYIDAYGFTNVQHIIYHTDHHHQTSLSDYDVALIQLGLPVRLSSNVVPACLANRWTENLYDTLVVTGYGLSTESGHPRFFESDDNQIRTCREVIHVNFMDGHVICVKDTGLLNAFTGQSSGSPLQSVNSQNCMATVVGIMGFGPSPISTVYGYIRISQYIDWIEAVVWNVTTLRTSNPVTTSKSNTIGTPPTRAPIKAGLPNNTDFVFPNDD